MAFTPIARDEGKEIDLPMTASTTLTKNNHCKMTSGYLAAGSAGDNEAEYISTETKVSSTGNGSSYARMLLLDDQIQFIALTGTTPVQATHVGNDYDFADAATIDLTATTDKVFHVDAIVSAADKLILGHFNKPALA